MTTVAWDGRLLAADSRCVDSGRKGDSIKKVFTLDKYVVAGSGSYASLLKLVRGMDSKENEIKIELEQNFHGFVWDREDQRMWQLFGDAEFQPLTHKWAACGSGGDFAFSAMALGFDAQEAVRFASKYDVHTGGRVQVVDTHKLV